MTLMQAICGHSALPAAAAAAAAAAAVWTRLERTRALADTCCLPARIAARL